MKLIPGGQAAIVDGGVRRGDHLIEVCEVVRLVSMIVGTSDVGDERGDQDHHQQQC